MKPLLSILAVALGLACGSAHAFCFAEAAARYRVDESLLVAIAKTESGLRGNALHVNEDGSEDIGLMQINSGWLPKLQRHGIDRAKLLDPCVNANIGAWILAENFVQHGRTWKAVGAYNARSESKQQIYIKKVWGNLMRKPSTSTKS